MSASSQALATQTGLRKDVAYPEVAQAYGVEKDVFAPPEEENCKRARVAGTQSIQIQEFVLESEINSRFVDRHYLVEPDRRGVDLRTAPFNGDHVSKTRFGN